jgi:hypothetical protein
LITICSQMPPNAAVGRWSRDIRGMEIGAFSQVVPKNEKGPRDEPVAP